MPHKFNAARRHKFPKKRYRVTNWAEYTEILRRRGDLTICVIVALFRRIVIGNTECFQRVFVVQFMILPG